MALGMTYNQYWYGDPLMVRAFYKADRIRQERKDSEAWLNGLYVLRALEATVGNVFRKEGTQPAEYPERPYSAKETAEEPTSEDEEERERLMAELYLMQFERAGRNWGKNRKKEVSADA